MTSASPRSFDTTIQVRFGDVDAAGIVYFPRIFDYIHQVFEELWDAHVGRRYFHVLGEERLGFPLVRSEVDFRRPLRFGDRPTVRVTTASLGRSSIGLHYRFYLDDLLCVDARMTVACVELDGLKSTPVPARYRAKLEEIREVA
jgi:4-hydroxybenzoyl-CoA thioesterase